ncbi:unnamed protein product, partial [Didymodactylos carnosus]
FIQNEQIKSQVVEQDGLSVLTTCANDSKFDMVAVQLPSLEVIWAIVFSLPAAQLLRENLLFLDYIEESERSSIGITGSRNPVSATGTSCPRRSKESASTIQREQFRCSK